MAKKRQESWSSKDRRMYEAVKESAEQRGSDGEAATEIAARTVNKQRREEGRTPNRTPRGSGNPNKSLEERTVDELRNRTRELDVAGRSKMNKAQLVSAIRARQ